MAMPERKMIGGELYRYAFQGQELDSETGKEAFQLRLWDGRIGRWLTTDPAGQYASPYLGMGNNPVSRWDPDGGCDQPDADCGFFKRIYYRTAGRGNEVDAWKEFHNPSTNPFKDFKYTHYFNVGEGELLALYGVSEEFGVSSWQIFPKGPTTGEALQYTFEFILDSFGPLVPPLAKEQLEGYDNYDPELIVLPGVPKFPKRLRPRSHGWLKSSYFKKLGKKPQASIIKALQNGIIPASSSGVPGIKPLTQVELRILQRRGMTGYTHKLKFFGGSGHQRFLGKHTANGKTIFFDKLTTITK